MIHAFIEGYTDMDLWKDFGGVAAVLTALVLFATVIAVIFAVIGKYVDRGGKNG